MHILHTLAGDNLFNMPLLIYQNNHTNSGRLLIWKVTESLAELEARYALKGEEKSAYEAIVLEKRKKEWLMSRILLQIAVGAVALKSRANGKPYLEGQTYISISHSGELAGLYVCDHECGLDIQGTDEKLERIKRKYCHQDELMRAGWSSDELSYLTIIWSAKEAVFKYFGEEVIFAEDMVTRPFSVDQTLLQLDYQGKHGSQRFELEHVYLHGYHIVYTL